MNDWEVLLRKSLVASGLDTAGWQEITTAIRNRAFFSAEVMNMRLLHEMRENVVAIMQRAKSPSEARRDLREYLSSIGYDPGENRGTLKDLTTRARLDVMIKTNVDQARGYANHLKATTPGAILAYPGYELVRVKTRRVPRDWSERWRAAGDAVGWEGASRERMIALKTSPIWAHLSRFGNPFPPFDFNSGMGLKDVKKSVCREIGLLAPDEQPKIPPRADFNANLDASVPFTEDSPEGRHLKKVFGDQISFSNGKVRWSNPSN